jgi:High potential iron-sulfur protein
MADRVKNIPRRRLIRTALTGAAVGLALGVIAKAETRVKMSRAEAAYQDSPKDIQMCATCTLFEPPRSCRVVEGTVSPNGWCNAFELAD